MPAGRPTVYDSSYNDLAYKYCLLGATDEQLASFFDVCVRTIQYWKKQYPEFLHSIKRGKDLADAEIAGTLFNKALGFTHKEGKTFMYRGKVSIVPTNVYYPPDTTAMIFWLKNRQPEYWRGRHNINHAGDRAHSDMDKDQLDRRLQELLIELELSKEI